MRLHLSYGSNSRSVGGADGRGVFREVGAPPRESAERVPRVPREWRESGERVPQSASECLGSADVALGGAAGSRPSRDGRWL